MSIIKPRDGFINVVNMSLCSDYLKKKLKEYGYTRNINKYNWESREQCLLLLSQIADEANKEFCPGSTLFYVVSDPKLSPAIEIKWGEVRPSVIFGNSSEGCWAVHECDEPAYVDNLYDSGSKNFKFLSYDNSSYVSHMYLRGGRVEQDIKDLICIVASRFGFSDENGDDIHNSIRIEKEEQSYQFNVPLKYSINFSSAEDAEEFAKKWVLVLQEEAYKRYRYLWCSMVDPALTREGYMGYNRVFEKPEVLMGYVSIATSMLAMGNHWDKQTAPFASNFWDR